MKHLYVTRIYTGDDGESHFEDVEIPLIDRGGIGRISELQGRILLTRDQGLVKRSRVTRGYWLRTKNPRAQVVEVVLR